MRCVISSGAFYLLDFLLGRHLPSLRRLFPEETVTRHCSVERRVTNQEPWRNRKKPNLGPAPADWARMPLRGWHVPTRNWSHRGLSWSEPINLPKNQQARTEPRLW